MPEPLHYVNFHDWTYVVRESQTLAGVLTVSTFLTLLALYLFLRWKRKRFALQQRPSRLFRAEDLPAYMLLFCLSLILNLMGIHREALSSMEGTYLMEIVTNDSILAAFLNQDGVLNSHPPLYRTLVYCLLGLGQSPAFLRGISAVFGAICIVFLCRFSVFFMPRRLAVTGCALFLLSPINVYLSQNIMPYTLLSCLVLAHYIVFVIFLERPSRRICFLYVFTLALGLNTHAIFWGSLFPLFLVQLIRVRKTRKGDAERGNFYLYLEKTSLAFLFAVPFLAVQLVFLKFFTEIFPRMMAYLEVIHPVTGLSSRTWSFAVHLFSLLAGFYPSVSFTGVAALWLFIVASLVLLCSRGLQTFLLVSGPLYLLLFLQILAFSYLKQVFFEIRYYCFAPAFFWLTILFALDTAVKKAAGFPGRVSSTHRITLGFAGVLFLLPALHSCVLRPSMHLNPDLKSVAELLRNELRGGDAICVTPAAFFGGITLYHMGEPWEDGGIWADRVLSTQQTAFLPREPGDPGPIGLITNLLLPWEEASRNTFFHRIWLININERTLGYPEYSRRPFERVHAHLEKHGRFLETWIFPDVEVLLYETVFRIAGWEGHRFTLTLGKDDYPYLCGFRPPITTPAPFRSLTPKATIRIPIHKPVEKLRVVMDLESAREPQETPLLRIAYTLGRNRTQRDYRPAPGRGSIRETLPFPPEDRGPGTLEISFALPENSEQETKDPSKIRLYRIQLTEEEDNPWDLAEKVSFEVIEKNGATTGPRWLIKEAAEGQLFQLKSVNTM